MEYKIRITASGRYTEKNWFLYVNGKITKKLDRADFGSIRNADDTETRWINHEGKKIFYNSKNKVTEVL